MSLVSVGPLWLPQFAWAAAQGVAMTIDAANEVAWQSFSAPRTGNITRFHFRTGTVVTGATVDCRAETVDLATGVPTGTLINAGGSNVAVVILDTDDNTIFRTGTFTASAAVTQGEAIALVIANPGASFGNIPIQNFLGTSYGDVSGAFSMRGGPDRATEVSQSSAGWLVEYDDGVVVCADPTALSAAFTLTGITMDTGTNPDEVGQKFTPPAAMRLAGFAVPTLLAASGSYKVNLYIDGNHTPVLTQTYDSDLGSGSGTRKVAQYFTSSYTLSVGVVYRIAFVPLTTVDMIIWKLTCGSNAYFDHIGIPGAHLCQRNRSGTSDPDSAAWTDTTTDYLQMSLMIDQIDNGAAGGSGLAHIIGG